MHVPDANTRTPEKGKTGIESCKSGRKQAANRPIEGNERSFPAKRALSPFVLNRATKVAAPTAPLTPWPPLPQGARGNVKSF